MTAKPNKTVQQFIRRRKRRPGPSSVRRVRVAQVKTGVELEKTDFNQQEAKVPTNSGH